MIRRFARFLQAVCTAGILAAPCVDFRVTGSDSFREWSGIDVKNGTGIVADPASA